MRLRLRGVLDRAAFGTHVERSANIRECLTSLALQQSLLALMRSKFRLSPQLHATRLGSSPAIARSYPYQFALEFSQAS